MHGFPHNQRSALMQLFGKPYKDSNRLFALDIVRDTEGLGFGPRDPLKLKGIERTLARCRP